MTITHRLHLLTVPGILGVLLTAGLAYRGEYTRAAPIIVIVLAALVTTFSLILAWTNARYMAIRVEHLARRDPPATITHSSHGLIGAVAPGQRAHDYARLLATLSEESIRRLEEVRLPLHILLENHFGDLNENQEEMLGAARAAAEAVDSDVRRLGEIASLDLGELHLRHDRIKPSEMIDALRPLLMAAAEHARVILEIDVAPLLPFIVGDRARLQDAMITVLRSAIASTCKGGQLHLSVEKGDAMTVECRLTGAGATATGVAWVAAVRLIQAHNGSVDREAGTLRITLLH